MNYDIIIRPECSLFDALSKMDQLERKLLVVCAEKKFEGVISIGDIQRAIIKKIELTEPVIKHIRNDILYCTTNDSINEIKKMMMSKRIECMPIVDQNGNLKEVVNWEDLFTTRISNEGMIKHPVMIMAGGEGQRLRPLTNIIPKPLIPISKYTIVEEIMNRFAAIGSKDFYLSINYKADVIKDYFLNKTQQEYIIHFVQEKEPLGTAGSLWLVKEFIRETFFVSNCDVLVGVNYTDLLSYHTQNGNIATAVSVIKDYSIPYGTIETKEGGLLVRINEKPTITYQINSGLYVLEPKVFDYITEGETIHITDLFARLIKNGEKVGVFPVPGSSYLDMGNWEDYMRVIKKEY